MKSACLCLILVLVIAGFSYSAQTSCIAIDGSVFYDDGVTPVPNGWNVDVTNKTQNLSQVSKTGDGPGRYSVTFITFDPEAIVAATGDKIDVAVTDADGNPVQIIDANGNKQDSLIYILTDEDIDMGSAAVNVVIDILAPPVPITKLVVSGTVYYKNGKIPAAGLTVKVLETSVDINDAGKYSVTIEEAGEVVAKSGDEITIVVEKDGTEVGKVTYPWNTR